MLTQAQKNQMIKKFEGFGLPESFKPQIPRILEDSSWDEVTAMAMINSVDVITEEQKKLINQNQKKQADPPIPFNMQYGNQLTLEQQQWILQAEKIRQYEEEQQKFAIQESLNKQDDKPINERLRLQGIPVGLQNFGNTCYFNCISQIIFANPILTELIMSFRPSKIDSPIIKAQEKFLLELQFLIARLMITNEKYKKPEDVYKAAQALQKIVAKKQQGEFQVGNFYDVSEYFDTILQLIDQSLSTRVEDRLDSLTIFENQTLNQQYCSSRNIANRDEYAVQFLFNAKDQFIYQSFLKQIDQQEKYKTLPNNIVIQLSRFVDDKQKQDTEYWFSTKIYLDFMMGNEAANVRLQQFVIQSQSNEEIELSIKLQREILAFERVINLFENKQIVCPDVVHSLKVEKQDLEEQSKKYFPKNIEELNFDLKVNSQYAYHLHIIVIHVGSAATGHYYMYLHNFNQNKWFKYNDYNVTIETEDTVMNDAKKNGNILFYVNQEQKIAIEQYEKELKEIEQKLFQLGEHLHKIDQSNMKVLSLIPPKFQERLLSKENKEFQKEYDEYQAIIEKSKQVK